MIIVFLAVLGLALGSFVNALVWRLHEQSREQRAESRGKAEGKKTKTAKLNPQPSTLNPADLSVLKGRSMCVHCKHTLAAKDLVPLFSWLSLGGKCRYCRKPISWQYPVVEAVTAALFVISYIFWPESSYAGVQSSVNFIAWLVFLVGFVALLVYDIKWMLLPNRIVYPMLALAAALAVYNIVYAGDIEALYKTLISCAIAGGIFYALFVISNGRWIGGGDVKLGLLIGLVLGEPYLAFLMLLTASTLGTAVILPPLLLKKLTPTSRVPFGPFLIIAAIITQLFGASVIEWYERTILLI